MKTIETDSRWPKWLNYFCNWLAADVYDITSVAKAEGPWGTYWANVTSFWRRDDSSAVLILNPWTQQMEAANQYQSHIWNARYFHRKTYVNGKLRGLAWSWRPAGKNYKHTIILGTKLNGRFALTFRFFHTDDASARGTNGPNYGQATGDTFGPA